jgi:hypothetical protein
MEFIKISSKGEIDIRAFSKMGASSKRNDSTKIGMFGSGLKYSIAYLLRNKINFKVFSGYREVIFTTKEEVFRDKIINTICINDRETDLTTEMGMDWEHWFVIREIYCNALDESDGKIEIVKSKLKDIKPTEDFTTFYIEVDSNFKDIINNWNDYFSEKRTDLIYSDSDFNQIYVGGEKLSVYRKGILCHKLSMPSLFHYDMSWVQINESRTILSEWDFKYKLVSFIKNISDNKIIHRIIYNINNYWEKDLHWDLHGLFSDAWKKTIGKKWLIPYESAGLWEEEIKGELKGKHIILPNSMIKSLKLSFGSDIRVVGQGDGDSKGSRKVIENLDKKQQYYLDEAIGFLKNSEYSIKYPVKVVKFSNEDTLGQAENETIYLSEKLFNMGMKKIVAVIVEENEHNVTGFGDMTRAFQDHIFHLYISSLEDKSGKYL